MPCENLRLTITQERFTFVPANDTQIAGDRSQPALVVDRKTGDLTLDGEWEAHRAGLASSIKERTILGLLGFIQLQTGGYAIVITKRELVGTLSGCDIYRAKEFDVLAISYLTKSLSKTQMEAEDEYLQLLKTHLRTHNFYFSYTYDLTLSVQRRVQQKRPQQPMWKNADQRFFWNRFLSEKLMSAPFDASNFILPVLDGFVSITRITLNKKPVIFGLISRRSHERAGTRYFTRGLDDKGHASNFVETEQLLLYDADSSLTPIGRIQLSFVQTRGSIPALWRQIPNVRYTPQLWFNNSVDVKSLEPSRLHFEEQIRHYGSQILVNLVNKKGYEYPLGELYASIVRELGDPRLLYVHFDFHQECRNMRWHRVQGLLSQLEPELRKQAYCHVDAADTDFPTLRKVQTSVVRSNCMDCLDRTNVVQSTLARWMLNRQLHEIGLLPPTGTIERDVAFMNHFRTVWANNADSLSQSYSGTDALKTDYTRTGKRTYVGALQDLKKSLVRYAKNNYLDGIRQDSIDLFLGHYQFDGSDMKPIHRGYASDKPWTIQLIPLILVVSYAAFCLALFFPDYTGTSSSSTFYIFVLSFWLSIAAYLSRYVWQNGVEFVNWPRFVEVFPIVPTPQPTRWSHRRTSTAILDNAEQGYELPTLKKET